MCIPNDAEVKRLILEEGHKSHFSLHPGMTKMYHDLKETFWWQGMKKDVAQFVSACLTWLLSWLCFVIFELICCYGCMV